MSLTASSLQTRPAFAGQAVEQRQTRAQRAIVPHAARAQAEEQVATAAAATASPAGNETRIASSLLDSCR